RAAARRQEPSTKQRQAWQPAGIALPLGNRTPIDHEQLARDLDSGATMAEAARAQGVSPSTARARAIDLALISGNGYAEYRKKRAARDRTRTATEEHRK